MHEAGGGRESTIHKRAELFFPGSGGCSAVDKIFTFCCGLLRELVGEWGDAVQNDSIAVYFYGEIDFLSSGLLI